jgi:lambda repressor-like predicted transcriptional regulator
LRPRIASVVELRCLVLTGVSSKTRQVFLTLSVPQRAATRPTVNHRERQVQVRLTDSQTDDLVSAYESGEDMRRLAARFGVHRRTVATTLRTRNIPLRRQGPAEADINRAANLYRAGWSLAKIGDEFKCTAETVRRAFKRAGLQRRPPWQRATVAEPPLRPVPVINRF